MPNPLTTLKKNGVYTILTPGEDGFLIGHCEGHPVVTALSEELVEAGVKEAFIDAENPKSLPDPLNLPKYLEHLKKEG